MKNSKDKFLEKVLQIADGFTGRYLHVDGQSIVSDDGSIIINTEDMYNLFGSSDENMQDYWLPMIIADIIDDCESEEI